MSKRGLLHAFFARLNETELIKRWKSDIVFREHVALYGSLIFNLAYSVLLLWLGIYHQTFWFYSLAGYYFLLALMRFFLLKHLTKYTLCEKIHLERLKCGLCGVILLIMSLALGAVVFFMVYWGRSFIHHEVTTIALAAYTFTALTVAIISLVKNKRHNSPVLFASKTVTLVAASVSMLTLTATMLTTFGGAGESDFNKIMLAMTGGAVILLVISMAIIMIVKSIKIEEK